MINSHINGSPAYWVCRRTQSPPLSVCCLNSVERPHLCSFSFIAVSVSKGRSLISFVIFKVIERSSLFANCCGAFRGYPTSEKRSAETWTRFMLRIQRIHLMITPCWVQTFRLVSSVWTSGVKGSSDQKRSSGSGSNWTMVLFICRVKTSKYWPMLYL